MLEVINNQKIITGSSSTLNDTVVEFSKAMIDMKGRVAITHGELIKRLIWPFTGKRTRGNSQDSKDIK